MRIQGRREKRTRLVQTDRFIIAVDVEAVYPPDDPTEPCYESETIELLRDIQKHAEAADIDWLIKHGRVYQRVEAA